MFVWIYAIWMTRSPKRMWCTKSTLIIKGTHQNLNWMLRKHLHCINSQNYNSCGCFFLLCLNNIILSWGNHNQQLQNITTLGRDIRVIPRQIIQGLPGHLFRISLKNSYEFHYPSINHIPNLRLVSFILFELLPSENYGQFTKIVADPILDNFDAS